MVIVYTRYDAREKLNLPCIQMIFCLFIIKIGIVLEVHSLCVALGSRPKI